MAKVYRYLLIVLVFSGVTAAVWAQQSSPSFEAVVVGSQCYAFSGPGFEYYPTTMLPKGSKVTVTGEKVGEWYKVLPPASSFSLVPARAVEEKEDGTGEVLEPEVQVRIGSNLSSAHHVYQLVLKKGQQVQILDQVYLKNEDSVGAWYKIASPANEVRYVAASQIKVPSSEPETLNNSFQEPLKAQVPTQPTRFPQPVGGAVIPPAKMIIRSTETEAFTGAVEKSLKAVPITDDPKAAPGKRLESLDQQLSKLPDRAPESWDLATAKKILEDIHSSATDEEKQTVWKLMNRVKRLEILQSTFLRARRRHELTVQRDEELQRLQQRELRTLSQMRPQFTAQGILERAATTIDERQAWTLADETGLATHFVIAPPGLDLEKYVGTKVGLLGDVEQRSGVRVPLLRLQQLVPLQTLAETSKTTQLQ